MSDGVDPAILRHLDNRFGEIRAMMADEAGRASESRSRMFERMEKQGKDMVELRRDVERLQDTYEEAAPTLHEFRTMKLKADGAGILGRVLLRFGGWVLGAAAALYAARDQIAAVLKALFVAR
jgi:hypothetical protein